jgi:hypothetical protein
MSQPILRARIAIFNLSSSENSILLPDAVPIPLLLKKSKTLSATGSLTILALILNNSAVVSDETPDIDLANNSGCIALNKILHYYFNLMNNIIKKIY